MARASWWRWLLFLEALLPLDALLRVEVVEVLLRGGALRLVTGISKKWPLFEMPRAIANAQLRRLAVHEWCDGVYNTNVRWLCYAQCIP